MRYKVKAPSEKVFLEVHKQLEGRTKIFLVSPRRRSLSTGDLSRALIRKLTAEGVKVAPEYQFEPDATDAL